MMFWLSTFLIFVNLSFAGVGKISKLVGTNDAFIIRNSKKINLSPDASIEKDDEIVTQSGIVLIQLDPSMQISLAKNTTIKLTNNSSVISFIKGIIRVQVSKVADQEIEQQVIADGVTFTVRGTEFEVSNVRKGIHLDVIEGEVEASSPFVQTFVPEIIKANEGFRFNRKEKNFQRRKIKLKFKDHPGFQSV